jgi:carboxypeptidase D
MKFLLNNHVTCLSFLMAVVASMKGFRPKATRIVLLEEEAVNLDFILDPNIPDGQVKLLRNECGCRCDDERLFHVQGPHLGLYVLVPFVLLALYLLLKRKSASRWLTYRYSPRRPIAV